MTHTKPIKIDMCIWKWSMQRAPIQSHRRLWRTTENDGGKAPKRRYTGVYNILFMVTFDIRFDILSQLATACAKCVCTCVRLKSFANKTREKERRWWHRVIWCYMMADLLKRYLFTLETSFRIEWRGCIGTIIDIDIIILNAFVAFLMRHLMLAVNVELHTLLWMSLFEIAS